MRAINDLIEAGMALERAHNQLAALTAENEAIKARVKGIDTESEDSE